MPGKTRRRRREKFKRPADPEFLGYNIHTCTLPAQCPEHLQSQENFCSSLTLSSNTDVLAVMLQICLLYLVPPTEHCHSVQCNSGYRLLSGGQKCYNENSPKPGKTYNYIQAYNL